MLISRKHFQKFNRTFDCNQKLSLIFEKVEVSFEESRYHCSLKKTVDKTGFGRAKKLNPNLPILNYMINNTIKKNPTMTFISNPYKVKLDYDLNMVHKFDEDINQSWSFISEFDLDKEEKESDDSFDSSNNNDELCEEIIYIEKNKNLKKPTEDKDIDIESDKEWNDVKNYILNRNYNCAK